MNVTIVGTGYVGLVTGACLAELGNNVFCLDLDRNKVDLLNAGGMPIHEPGLEELIQRNVEEGRLAFSCDVAASVAFAELQFIAVGTPPDQDGSADLRCVLAAARAIGRHMDGFKLVVDKSTVPVGTALRVAAVIREELARRGRGELAFSVASNPEFLKARRSTTSCGRTGSCWARTRTPAASARWPCCASCTGPSTATTSAPG